MKTWALVAVAVRAMAAGAALGDHIIESLGLGAQLARAASE